MLLDMDRSINDLVGRCVTMALTSNTFYTHLPSEQCVTDWVRNMTDIQDNG